LPLPLSAEHQAAFVSRCSRLATVRTTPRPALAVGVFHALAQTCAATLRTLSVTLPRDVGWAQMASLARLTALTELEWRCRASPRTTHVPPSPALSLLPTPTVLPAPTVLPVLPV